MGKPRWRNITPDAPKPFLVPEDRGVMWTLVLDYVAPGKLLMIRASGTWTPEGGEQACGPDGETAVSDHAGLPVARAARGALIGRIGGGSADQVPDEKMLLFVIGRVCVLQVPDDRRGSLLLGVNDKPEATVGLSGHLSVEIFEAV
jgi:hypothetical protein